MDITQKILMYCKTPKTREEIAKICGFSKPSYMIKKYVMPLVQEDLLKMTIPDKPKIKNQKYLVVFKK